MSNIVVFPFDEMVREFLKYDNFYDNIFILKSRDVNFALDGLNKVKIINDLLEVIDQVDSALILSNHQQSCLYEKEIIDLIEKKKKIYTTKETKELYKPLINYENIYLLDYPDIKENYSAKNIIPIPVPVISFLADGENCDNFLLQINFKHYFEEQGYKVLAFADEKYAALFDINPFPEFIFKPMSLVNKIVAFNHYIYEKIFIEKPDIVILGSSGGILPINMDILQDYGERSIVISSAAIPDIVIRSIYYGKYDLNFFEEDKKRVKYKLASPVEYYHVSQTGIVYPLSLFEDLGYVKVPKEKVYELIEKKDIKSYGWICNMLEGDVIKEVGQDILNKLYVSYEIL